MTELLVVPYRDGDAQLADDFNALLSVYPNLDWIPPNLEIADLAARIRALHGLKTPDALQAATAINMQATAFVTNDKIFERVGAFDTIILDRLLSHRALSQSPPCRENIRQLGDRGFHFRFLHFLDNFCLQLGNNSHSVPWAKSSSI